MTGLVTYYRLFPVSSGNSPTLRRRSTYLETIWRRNPFSNLRRTTSQQLSVVSSNPRPLSTGDLDVVIVPQLQTSTLLKSHSAHTTPVPSSRDEFIRNNIIPEQSPTLVDFKMSMDAVTRRSSTGTLTAQPTGGRSGQYVCYQECIRTVN